MFHLDLPHPFKPTNSVAHPRSNHAAHFHFHGTQHPMPPPNHRPIPVLISPVFNPRTHNFSRIARCTTCNGLALPAIPVNNDAKSDADNLTEHHKSQGVQEGTDEKNFWGAVSLIIGTAVGPGMLGLPAATISSGPFPSTIVILLSWVYVVSSIILVAELSFAAMEEDGVEEVSFTGLAAKAVGSRFGAFVALVYVSLCFSLLVACVSGIGSLVSQWFPWMNLVMAHALIPLTVGTVILFFPFKAIDAANRVLCLAMLLSIAALVVVGLSVAKTKILGSFAYASWGFSSILPAIPVTVLTLGFHVITPFICKIAGNTVHEARKAILVGGVVPLIMVLSWNLIVLGLAGVNRAASRANPISLLLSVNPSASPAIQCFAFSALATSLIGYSVSFPKQLLDTLDLIFGNISSAKQITARSQMGSCVDGIGRVGFVVYSGRPNIGKAGEVFYADSSCRAASKATLKSAIDGSHSLKIFLMTIILGAPVLIASFFRSTFSRAIDFAGVYANCFLFGILPPAMAYISQSRKKIRSSILPGGDVTLLLLLCIAVILGIWH
ncbi:tyrosine-specific transport protein [Juglans microcarpa x Juglans regia]|uniref:tyrosine-specific transport protein n=1 Tax=Juglans microcarpa x Juglans regia TaxID=2249226 RepID=UPI001B7E1D58|nr:tyrosine-specific transport protein [Juglans microcarpa x Juglans regia]